MNTLIVRWPFLFFLSNAPVCSSDLEQVLEGYYLARGGLASMRSVHSVIRSASIWVDDERVNIKIYVSKSKVRLEIKKREQVIVYLFDGESSFIVNHALATREGAPTLTRFLEEFNFAGGVDPFVDWEKKGHQVSLIEPEDEEITLHHLLLWPLGGFPEHHYLDQETFEVTKVVRRYGDPPTVISREIQHAAKLLFLNLLHKNPNPEDMPWDKHALVINPSLRPELFMPP